MRQWLFLIVDRSLLRACARCFRPRQAPEHEQGNSRGNNPRLRGVLGNSNVTRHPDNGRFASSIFADFGSFRGEVDEVYNPPVEGGEIAKVSQPSQLRLRSKVDSEVDDPPVEGVQGYTSPLPRAPHHLDHLILVRPPPPLPRRIARRNALALCLGERLGVTPEHFGLAIFKARHDPPIMGELRRGRADRLDRAVAQCRGEEMLPGQSQGCSRRPDGTLEREGKQRRGGRLG